MYFLVYFVFLCSTFLLVKSEDNCEKNIMGINVIPGLNCTMTEDSTFTEGQKITLVVGTPQHINYGWWRLKTENGTRILRDSIKTTKDSPDRKSLPIIHTAVIDKSMQGMWEFEFYMLKDNPNYLSNDGTITRVQYNGSTYVVTLCQKVVTIVPANSTTGSCSLGIKNIIIIACCLGTILIAIIAAEGAYIFFLNAKARKLITLNTHNNLSKKSNSVTDDTARYCSNPRQKMSKQPLPEEDDNRDSIIYEDPHMDIPSSPRSPMQPPQVPSIATMPRTPRPDHNMRVGPQAMPPSARNSPARNLTSEHQPINFQRQMHDHELNLANRPPLPLPNQGHPFLHNAPHIIPQNEPHRFDEVYEEMEPEEEDLYEPPPVVNTTPARLPVPPKKIPTNNLLGENPQNLRQWNKPPVTPKPQRPRSNTMNAANEFEQATRKRNDTMATSQELEQAMRRRNDKALAQESEQPMRRRNETMPKPAMTPMQQELAMRRRPNGGAPTSELEEVLRRRNNVLPVPIQSIPDPSARVLPIQKPPPPPAKPPVPQPVQEEIYYNENQASSDEEWTYEPLKPLNSYDTNIYNI